MRKFLAVVKREYVQRVRSKFFVIATILGPVLMAAFTIVPAMMMGIKSGGPTRLVIVDQTGRMYERLARELSSPQDSANDSQATPTPLAPTGKPQVNQPGQMSRATFTVEESRVGDKSLADVRHDLEARIQNREIDGYIVLPPGLLKNEQPEYRARNAADVFTKETIGRSLSAAVRGQRLVESGINEKDVERASAPVRLKTIEAGGIES
jgi:ABC-2 type transport system permease protein